MKPLMIIQARMGSTRLPGKVMMPIRGRVMIGYLLERMMRFDPIVAIPAEDSGGLGIYLRQYGRVFAYDGPVDDVAGRFAAVLAAWSCDAFIRICADSPLLDPALVDAAVALYSGIYFLVSSPVGSVEICPTADFLKELPGMSRLEREHVLSRFERWYGSEAIYVGGGDARLVVDTQEDFDRVAAVIGRMNRDHREYGWRECLFLAS